MIKRFRYAADRASSGTGGYFYLNDSLGGPPRLSSTKRIWQRGEYIHLFNSKPFPPLYQIRLLRLPAGIAVLKIDPKSSDESWPYSNYPPLFPLVPLRLERRVRCSLKEFAELSCQPLRAVKNKAIVLIPSIPAPGLSLWGPDGEGECVQIVFTCDLLNGLVEGYNQCG